MRVGPLLLLLTGCASGVGEPCSGLTCEPGLECLANRCVAKGGRPVPEGARRVTALPTKMAFVSQESPEAHVPPLATLGAKVDGNTRWFVAFEHPVTDADSISRAFLLVMPADGGAAKDFEVDVWTIHDAWDPTELRYRTHPPFGRPHAVGLARSLPPSPLRIDVTDIVRHQVRRQAGHGLVIAADGGDGHGAQYFTGASGGAPPMLEIYLSPSR